MFFGDSEGYTTQQRLVMWKIADEEAFVLQKTESGMFVSFKVRGPDGKLVAQAVDNELFVNLGDAYRLERPSPSALVLYDSHNDRVIDIQFLNPRVIKILGRFFGPNGESITITENEQVFASRTGARLVSHHSCFGGGAEGLIQLRPDGAIWVQ
jgi:hypothetical protein